MRRAFTLVELIVVVIIIGILLSVGIPQYRKALERSRGAEAYAGLSHIQQGEKVYFASYEYYLPTTNNYSTAILPTANQSQLDINLPQNGWNFNVSCSGVDNNGNCVSGYTATAFRKSGPCTGRGGGVVVGNLNLTITVTDNGTITDTWKSNCVDLL